MGLVGVSHPMFLDDQSWLSLNWAVISLLAVHSLGRAVVRNEQEAIFRDPRLWDPNLLPDREALDRVNDLDTGGGARRNSAALTLTSRADGGTMRGMSDAGHGTIRSVIHSLRGSMAGSKGRQSSRTDRRQSGQSWDSTQYFLRPATSDHSRSGSESSEPAMIPDSPHVDPYRLSGPAVLPALVPGLGIMDVIIESSPSDVGVPMSSPHEQRFRLSPHLSQMTDCGHPIGTPRAY